MALRIGASAGASGSAYYGSAYPEDVPVYSASATPELYNEERLCAELTIDQIRETVFLRLTEGREFYRVKENQKCK